MNEGSLGTAMGLTPSHLSNVIATVTVNLCANGFAVSVYNQRQYVYSTLEEALAKVKELFVSNGESA